MRLHDERPSCCCLLLHLRTHFETMQLWQRHSRSSMRAAEGKQGDDDGDRSN